MLNCIRQMPGLMNRARVAPQADIGRSPRLFATAELTSNEQQFGQVGVFREIGLLGVMARNHSFQVVVVGEQLARRPHASPEANAAGSTKARRPPPSRCLSARATNTLPKPRGRTCRQVLESLLEVFLQHATFIRQGTEEQIAADAAHKGRVHHAEVQLGQSSVRFQRHGRAGADCFNLRIVERHLCSEFSAVEKIQAAKSRPPLIDAERHDKQMHPNEGNIRGEQGQGGS